MSLEFNLNLAFNTDSVELRAIDRAQGKHGAVLTSWTLHAREDTGAWIPPAAYLERSSCQQLMDELWRVGFRPSEGSGSAGSLAATERHLKDMQQIAMGLLKNKGVEL